MSTLKNSVRLVGNLGMDPEVKVFGDNKRLAKLSLATNESYKNDKGEKEPKPNGTTLSSGAHKPNLLKTF